MKICEGIYLEVLGAGCRLNRGLVLEDGARRPPSYCSLHRLQVGRWPPRHVLQQKPLPRAALARLSPPLMEGSEWPC